MIGSVFRPDSQRGPTAPMHSSAPHAPSQNGRQIAQNISGMSDNMPVPLVRALALGAGQVPPAFPTLRRRAQPIVAPPNNLALSQALLADNSTVTDPR